MATKVSSLNSHTYYDWQLDTDTDNGKDGYTGVFGVTIEKLFIYLV